MTVKKADLKKLISPADFFQYFIRVFYTLLPPPHPRVGVLEFLVPFPEDFLPYVCRDVGPFESTFFGHFTYLV